MKIDTRLQHDIESLDEKHRLALEAVILQLQSQQSSDYWQFVQETAEKVKEWKIVD